MHMFALQLVPAADGLVVEDEEILHLHEIQQRVCVRGQHLRPDQQGGANMLQRLQQIHPRAHGCPEQLRLLGLLICPTQGHLQVPPRVQEGLSEFHRRVPEPISFPENVTLSPRVESSACYLGGGEEHAHFFDSSVASCRGGRLCGVHRRATFRAALQLRPRDDFLVLGGDLGLDLGLADPL
eukprot:CAMPEP_0178985984 /NCGR_PEP_ID=MMETSP0795-20121207/2452_1 /TAXON_ID=88552 /ORGANISM="Amoebophrya sp., Strain Ameob2" /LENGTH=181 /DNA_ID=CAMNT_0020676995 /DNA_START=365 /DNA_END=910 /DNA_ORIENTATION=+